MKRSIMLLLAILITAFATGCDNEIVPPASQDSSSDESSFPIDSIVSADPYEEPKALFGVDKGGSVTHADYIDAGELTILDSDISGQYLITVVADIEGNNSRALIYNIYDGSKLREIELTDYNHAQVTVSENGNIMFSDGYGRYMLYEHAEVEEPIEQKTADAESSEIYTFFYDGAYIMTDEARISIRSPKEEEKQICDLSDRFGYVYFEYNYKDKLIFSGHSSETNETVVFSVSTDGSDYTPMRYESRNIFTDGETLFRFEYDGKITLTESETSPVSQTINLEKANEFVFRAGNGRIFSSESDEPGVFLLKIYRYDGGLVYKQEIEFGELGNTYLSSCAQHGDRLIMTLTGYNEEADESQERVIIFDIPEDEEISREDGQFIVQLAEEISERYDVTIYADYGANRTFPDFSAAACTNEADIRKALTMLDDTLGKFPKGFFSEMFSSEDDVDSDEALVIYLVGKITPITEGMTNNPIAFTFREDNKRIMVLDIASHHEMVSTIAHEIMHMIDTYVSEKNYSIDEIGFEDWFDYLPERFNYAYSYVDDYGFDYSDPKYTVGSESDEIYFIDAYSKTFPGEDKCRIFENLFTGSDHYFKDNPKLAERARYLCQEIRDAFDCIGEDTVIEWEKALQ